MLCCRDYSERVVASFAHHIQSEYYDGNRSVSIEGITLENFSALPNTEINSSTKSCPRHAVFRYFLLDDSKQDAANTNSHSKSLIELLKEQKVLSSTLSTIWGKTNGCAEQYICASTLCLMSFFSECYSIIIDRGISAPGHGKEVVDGLNAIDKRYTYQLMFNVQLP